MCHENVTSAIVIVFLNTVLVVVPTEILRDICAYVDDHSVLNECREKLVGFIIALTLVHECALVN